MVGSAWYSTADWQTALLASWLNAKENDANIIYWIAKRIAVSLVLLAGSQVSALVVSDVTVVWATAKRILLPVFFTS
jgi:hypothetical protein